MNFVAGPVVQMPGVGQSNPVTQMAVGDFNGDGILDIVLTRFRIPLAPDSVPVLFMQGNGSGGFTLATNGATVAGVATVHPREVIVGDFNGDGRLDIFVADHGYDVNPFPGRQNTLILSSGATDMVDGTSRLPQQVDFTHSASFADVDGDGDLDIVSGNVFGQTLFPPQVLVNDGQGNFTIKQGAIPANLTDVRVTKFTSQEFVDIDNDGDPDLVLLGDQDTADYVLYNDGTGIFGTARLLPTKAFGGKGVGHDVDAIDINGDGRLDLIVSFISLVPESRGGMAAIYVQQADGSFVDETATRNPQLNVNRANDWLQWVELADLDGDGDLDAIAMYNANSSGNPGLIEIWTNNNGVFSIATAPGNQQYFNFARIGDVNNDGVPDIVTVNGGFGVQALINQAQNPAIAGTANAEALTGNGFANSITAGAGADTVSGGLGADTLRGGDGDDVVYGGADNDLIYGDLGNDWLDGDAGNDTMFAGDGNDSVRGLDGNDLIQGGAGADDLNGNRGSDTIYGGDGDDVWVRGGRDNDLVYGGTGNDAHVNGNIGADTVYGDDGNDGVFGGQNEDLLYGGAGNDTLSGDLGNDTLWGGAGADVFAFRANGGADRIGDFSFADGDRIQIATGTTWTVGTAPGGEALVTLSTGVTFTLAGVTPAAVVADWFVFGA